MKSKTYAIITALSFLFCFSGNVFAETGTSTRADIKVPKATQAMTRMIQTADKEIDMRISTLSIISSKIQSIKKVSTTSKESILATAEVLTNDLTMLKGKIDADTNAEILKADLKSITASYRIYALVRPQIEILVASDRINTLVSFTSALSTKISLMIASLKAEGKDTSVFETTLSNTNVKIADAKMQADAAIARTSILLPDNGNAALAASNKEALQKSHADIRVAHLDLHTVKTNLETIIKQIRKMRPVQTATSTEMSVLNQ